MSYADWREILDVTLDGAFHCVKSLPAGATQQSGGGYASSISAA